MPPLTTPAAAVLLMVGLFVAIFVVPAWLASRKKS